MLEVNLKKKYILRPLTRDMKRKIQSLENLTQKRIIMYRSGGLNLKLKSEILMTVVKEYEHGYIVYFYNYEYSIGEFKFLYKSLVDFFIRGSLHLSIKRDTVISQWRDFRDYKEYLKLFEEPKVKLENNLLKIDQLKGQIKSIEHEIENLRENNEIIIKNIN